MRTNVSIVTLSAMLFIVPVYALVASPAERPVGWASVSSGTSGGGNGTIDTAKNKQHKFSNLIGSDDSLAQCEGKLNITYHHCWWTNWVKERQPRSRYGMIHVVNNFFNSDSSSYCTNAGYHASVMAEYNLYLKQKNPLSPAVDSYGMTSRGNIFTNCSGTTAGRGAVFEPAAYYDTSFIDHADGLQPLITSAADGAGATLTWGIPSKVFDKIPPEQAPDAPFIVRPSASGDIIFRNSGDVRPSVALFDLSGRRIRALGPVGTGKIPCFGVPSRSLQLLLLRVDHNHITRTVPVVVE